MLTEPSHRLVISERTGRVPQENTASVLAGGACGMEGGTAFGFSQTWTPPLSVLNFNQPFLSKTGMYCGVFTNPHLTPYAPAFCKIGSSAASPFGNQKAVSIWPMPLVRSSGRVRAVW